MEILMKAENHAKRNSRNLSSLERKAGNRNLRPYVLIVCEGSKTEPYYFRDLCQDLKLQGVEIKPCPTGNDPINIVQYALRRLEKDDFDQVFCVFDKDDHRNNYDPALKQIKANTSKEFPLPIQAINSVPCFEFWLLLHFTYSTKPYLQKGKKSAGDQLESKIRSEHIPGYFKGYEKTFEKTKDKLTTAIKNAKKIDNGQKDSNSDNPSTKVHELIEYLQSISNIIKSAGY
jgi:hypothetical protein